MTKHLIKQQTKSENQEGRVGMLGLILDQYLSFLCIIFILCNFLSPLCCDFAFSILCHFSLYFLCIFVGTLLLYCHISVFHSFNSNLEVRQYIFQTIHELFKFIWDTARHLSLIVHPCTRAVENHC